MIAARRLQRSFADGLIAEEVQDLWEPWMRHADEALNDDQLLQIIQQELSKRYKKSKTRGRPGTPADVVLRMLLLKHMRGWSYEDVTREVRANIVYREFTGVGGGKVPDDKTMGRLARQLGPEAIEKLHQRTVAIAVEKKVVAGRKMRVDTTVVETNIHYPTDSTLMGDGVRVLIRVMKKVAAVVGEMGTKFRDRSRSVKRRVVEIAYASRDKSEKGQQKMKVAYGKLLEATSRVVGQAKKFSAEIAGKVKKGQRAVLQKAKTQLDEMVPRVQRICVLFDPSLSGERQSEAVNLSFTLPLRQASGGNRLFVPRVSASRSGCQLRVTCVVAREKVTGRDSDAHQIPAHDFVRRHSSHRYGRRSCQR